MALIAKNWMGQLIPSMRSLLAVLALLAVGAPALAYEPAEGNPLYGALKPKGGVTYLVLSMTSTRGTLTMAATRIPMPDQAFCEEQGKKLMAKRGGEWTRIDGYWCVDGIAEVVEVSP